MDFSLTDEQQLLLDSVDELMERYGTEQYFKECDEKHVWPQRTASRCWASTRSSAAPRWT